MSTDLKIEIFAYFTFYKSWLDMGIKEAKPDILEYYKDEFIEDKSFSEVFDSTFIAGIGCRLLLFSKIYLKEFDFKKVLNWRSLSDCYDHVTSVCDRDDLFGHLTIFERMFATCAYVQALCLRTYSFSPINLVNYGHIIWAMYFDKFTEKFYDEGGWNELKREANRCVLVFEVLHFLAIQTKTASYLQATREASLNYCQFKKATKYENCKYKHKGGINVCKLWIKFQIEHFEEYVRIPLGYEESADRIEIEMLMQHLKLICKFLAWGCDDAYILQDVLQGKFCSTSTLFSKTSDNGEEIKTREDLRIENLRISATAYNEFQNSRKCLETQLQSECSTQSEKIVANEIIEKTENVKKNSFEMETHGNKSGGNVDRNSPKGCNIIPDETTSPRFSTNIKTSEKFADLDLNYEIANMCFNNEKYSDNTCLRKEKRHYELTYVGNASSSSQKDEAQWNLKSPTKNILNRSNLYSENEISKSYNYNTEQSCTCSSNQMAVAQCERNAITNKMPATKNFLAVKEIGIINDRRINTNRELDTLSEEQDDPDRNLESKKGFETRLQGVCSTPSEEIVVYELTDRNKNCGNCKNVFLERGIPGNKRDAVLEEQSCIRFNNLKDETMCPVIETNPKNSTESANLNLNDKFTSFDSKNGKEDTYLKTIKRHSNVMNASNILSTRRNQNEEPDWYRKISPVNLPNPTDLSSNNQAVESHDARESSRSPLDSNFSNRNEDVYNENTEITDVSSTNQTTANHCEGNAIQKNLCNLNDSLAGIEVTNNNDGKINTNKELDKLREEQADPDIRNFLRMILVLGDRQGVQYVYGTLCSSEDGRENSQVKSKKRNKRSKKKPTK